MELEKYIPERFFRWINKNANNATDISFIREKNMFVTQYGTVCDSGCFVTKRDLDLIINKMCNGSLYSNQSTLKKGFLTLPEGHRVGVTGDAVNNANGEIEYLRNISGINIRIAREIYGASDKVLPYIKSPHGGIYNTLIIAPPSSGKTTILKDLIRNLGNIYRIGIIDERMELWGEESGNYAFFIKGCSKKEGILLMLRSMSPQIIITDEIGTYEDESTLVKLLNAGVKMICTAHGYDEQDIIRRQCFKKLIYENVFEKIIVISNRHGPGTLEKIIDTKELVKNA